MKLIQAKIRGLGATMETRWFDLSPQLNLFEFPQRESGKNFLHALQTINPPYSCQDIKPFAAFPTLIKQEKHTRHIIASKRTIALAVFGATPMLVKEIAHLNPLLYEADRIEVGRRLDYSRWINFVELASSSRWSEISTKMQQLLTDYRPLNPSHTDVLNDILATLKPSDRIKNRIQHQLTSWLNTISSKLGKGPQQHIEETLAAVCRADHFHEARGIVGHRLPLFVVLTSSTLRSKLLHFAIMKSKSFRNKSTGSEQLFIDQVNNQLTKLNFSSLALGLEKTGRGASLRFYAPPEKLSSQDPLASLRHLQADACLAIALSRAICGTNPILLFDEPDHHLPETFHSELADFVIKISQTCQCLYGYSHDTIFPKNSPGRHYSAAELSTSNE